MTQLEILKLARYAQECKWQEWVSKYNKYGVENCLKKAEEELEKFNVLDKLVAEEERQEMAKTMNHTFSARIEL